MTLPEFVGRYEVHDEIATGGFAVVVRAWDEELESEVAIKILRQEIAHVEEFRRNFLDEARLLRRIRAPNVVTVHDIGRLNDGRPYFVMDFANRGTLSPRLQLRDRGHASDPLGLANLVDAIGDGLSAIHEAGIVHRDVKPANILFQKARWSRNPEKPSITLSAGSTGNLVDPDERIMLGDLGIAKDLVGCDDIAAVVGGTPYYQAPEQAVKGAEVTPAADIYSATAVLWHVVTGERPPEPKNLADHFGLVPSAWRDVMIGGMAFEPKDRFQNIETWRSAIHQSLAKEAALTSGELPTVAVTRSEVCPFKGLAAYQSEDAAFFFGREALVDELLMRLRREQVLVVGGPSGSGKSSLIRAGLIPAVTAGALPGGERFRVALFTPGRDPLSELYFQVSRSVDDGRPSLLLTELLDRPTLARHLNTGEGSDSTLLLCVDQFEELFTLVPADQRQKFIDALSAMTDPADSRVKVVLAVRADFYADCAQIPWLAERITNNQILVGSMTSTELRRAITEPARRAGLQLEPMLVDVIIDESGDAGSLPLIAHALVETWLRRRGNTMTLEGFRAAGGVAGAISQTADTTYNELSESAEREATKRLFLGLVNPGQGTPDTRRILSLSELNNDPEPQVMHRAVERLTEARLLTVDDTSVQIAHEALLRTWPRLRRWIEESRDDLRTRQRISHAAEEWAHTGRDSDLLYRGTPLLSALDWEIKHTDQLGSLERDFLDASRIAMESAKAADQERRRKSRNARRIAVSALSFFAACATVASIVAYVEFRQAQVNEQTAISATVEAGDRFAGALGAVAYGLSKSDPLLAIVLGAEAIERTEGTPPTREARATLVEARRALAEGGPFLFGSPIPAGDALSISLSFDAAILATADRNGRIRFIDTASREIVNPEIDGHKGGIWDIEFGPYGRWLASAGTDGAVRVWHVGETIAIEGTTIGVTDDVVHGVSFGSGGSILASANGDGTVRLWDVANKNQLGEVLSRRSLLARVVEFSHDGHGVVAGYSDGAVYGWSLPSREPLFLNVRDERFANPSKIAFRPSGDRFAVASTDGIVILYEYPSGKIIDQVFQSNDRISTISFALNNKTLIGGSADGSIKLWDVDHMKQVRQTAAGHSQPIIDLELSSDGHLLATLGRDQLIRFWRFDTTNKLSSVRTVTGSMAKGIAISPDGQFLVAGDEGGTLQMWKIGADMEPRIFQGHSDQVWAAQFSPVGGLLATGDRRGELRIWSTRTGTLDRRIEAHDGPIWSADFTPDGTKVLSASDRELRLWNVETGNLVAEFGHDGGNMTRATMSRDGAIIATASADGTARVWDFASNRLVREVTAGTDVIWSVAINPDGTRLATGSSNEIITLWDLNSGQKTAELTGQRGGATDVVFLADGVTLVAVDRQGYLHLWDTVTGRRLTDAWQIHDGSSWRIAVHPDGIQFATAGDDGRVRLWDLFSLQKACEIGRFAFDSIRQLQYLGADEQLVACDKM
jgi:WD40 repeat protein/serine/threonine protein kinase